MFCELIHFNKSEASPRNYNILQLHTLLYNSQLSYLIAI